MMLANKSEVEGTVAVGGVTSDDLQGELKGKSLEDLHKLMLNGGIFVIVLTKEFPRGEIGEANSCRSIGFFQIFQISTGTEHW